MRAVIALLLLVASLWADAGLGEDGRFDPTVYAAYQIDRSQEAALEEIIAKPFEPLPGASMNRGYARDAIWFRIQPPGGPWVLEIQAPLLDHVDLYTPDEHGGYWTDSNGDALPFHARGIHFRHPVFRLPADIRQPVFLRIQSDGPVQIPLRMWRPDAFDKYVSLAEFLNGLYFGIMLIMVAYNLFLYLVVRDRNYLNYVFYIGVFILSQAALSGYGLQYLWPDSAWLANHIQAFLVGLLIYAGARFAHEFLDIQHNLPSFERPIRVVQWAALGIMAFTVFGPYSIAARLANYLGLILVLLILPAGIVCAWRRFRPAYWFVIAWGLFLVGVMTTGLTMVGLLPYNLFTAHAMQVGAALEVLLLSLALADRISSLRAEKDAARAEAHHNLLRSKEELEGLVKTRTHELTAANQALEEKNRILADIASHDGLTGLVNHAAFMALLAAQVEEARRYRYPIALMMIDIDHFKRINDHYGHQFGDKTLAAIAKVLAQGKRVSDEAARYGGEEFAILLPHTTLDAAVRLAERLRHAVAALSLEGAEELMLSASFGVAVIAEDDATTTPDQLIATADGAMYRAKREGRNRVCAGPESP